MKNICIIVSILCLFLTGAVSGCAFGNFGKANMSYSDITVPAGLTGQSKADVIKALGVPNSVARSGDIEYWGYSNKCGYFVLLFGKTIEKDLVLEVKGGTVTSTYLVDKGSSLGIFATQGSVSN
jgi:hypothetical protein